MDANSLEKQKKGKLYVYTFGAAGSRTPVQQPPATSVTKRIIPSSVWKLTKSKSKSKSSTDVVEKDKEEGKSRERKSVSSVEGLLMSLANNGNVKEEIIMEKESILKKGKEFNGKIIEGGRKSVSHVENNMAYVGKFMEKGRKSGAKLEDNVEYTIALLQVKVLVTDMPGFMQVHAFQCARNTYDSLEIFSAKHLSYNLKKEFDKVYGPAWHCIVGSSFGSFVTHATGCFLYFSMEKLCILLFRTKVQKALQK